MQKIFLATLLTILLFGAACKKNGVITPPISRPEEIDYLDFFNREIRNNTVPFMADLNQDGVYDVRFGTQLVGDPVKQTDRLQYRVSSNIFTKLPVNSNEEVPVFNAGSIIPLNDAEGFRWFQLSSVVLAQKVTAVNPPVYWEGNWKTAAKKYLPVQVLKNNLRFNGWIELTVDTTNEKLILHRAAISRLPEVPVKAG